MTQYYRILWYEDSVDFIDSLIDSIKGYVGFLGFDCSLIIERDGSKLDQEWLNKMDPDLIIVDYGLGDGKKGDEVVDKIKAIEPYAEVIFYSINLEDCKENIEVEGVYFSNRKDLFVKTQKIIDRTVRKQQDVNNMRGVIIAEAVDIEGKMEELILIALGPDAERKNVIKKIVDPEWQVLTFKKKFDLINKICKERIKTLREARNSANPTKKIEIDAKISEIEQKKEEFIDAEEEVINMRNIMAHASQDPSTGCLTSYLRKTDPVIVDDGFCKKTRKDLRKHAENLDKLIRLISTEI
ncbi:MAG: hypothetical protein D4S01_08640 [Dehalococcoidia bacterium]|nr:MAG: hypothetical protein D4S01_08640 [Dehalococcoidia bacterium]